MIKNIMKIASMCACAVVVSAFAVSVRAEGICTKKIAELERQLSIAKQHKNTGRAAGLERALENVRTWCTDDGELVKCDNSKVGSKALPGTVLCYASECSGSYTFRKPAPAE